MVLASISNYLVAKVQMHWIMKRSKWILDEFEYISLCHLLSWPRSDRLPLSLLVRMIYVGIHATLCNDKFINWHKSACIHAAALNAPSCLLRHLYRIAVINQVYSSENFVHILHKIIVIVFLWILLSAGFAPSVKSSWSITGPWGTSWWWWGIC